MAQGGMGRFAGTSTSWRPDYAGTLRMRSSGAITYTAIAEVELQRQQESFPGSGIISYEMRGEITLTSPLQTSQNGLTTTCQILKPVVPIRISRSGLTFYLGDEELPKNAYEIRIFQQVPLGECVSSDGRPPDPQPLPQSPLPLTSAEQGVGDEQRRIAEAMTHHPQMQQGLQDLFNQAQREGRTITPAKALALIEQLRRQGVIPERLPSLSAERQAELQRLGGPQGRVDVSHLRRTPSAERLDDQITVQTAHGSRTLSWSLRQVTR